MAPIQSLSFVIVLSHRPFSPSDYPTSSQLDMVDLWSDHSPWPHNTVPQSYSFLVKYPWLWWLSYTLTQPRFVHRTISLVTGWQVGHRVAMVRAQSARSRSGHPPFFVFGVVQ